MARSTKIIPATLVLVAGFGLAAFQAAPAAKGLTATLSGAQNAPNPGDADGTGSASVTFQDGAQNVCYKLSVDNIAAPTAAHIHRGKPGESGPPVVPLATPANGESEGCVTVEAEVAGEIEADPGSFYVNVHNAEFKPGAIRGQLARR
jgi:hypothetical protein